MVLWLFLFFWSNTNKPFQGRRHSSCASASVKTWLCSMLYKFPVGVVSAKSRPADCPSTSTRCVPCRGRRRRFSVESQQRSIERTWEEGTALSQRSLGALFYSYILYTLTLFGIHHQLYGHVHKLAATCLFLYPQFLTGRFHVQPRHFFLIIRANQ